MASRKKTPRPKHTLGLAVYALDDILQSKAVRLFISKKRIRPSSMDKILQSTLSDIESIERDISKNNYKAHYLEDKVRYLILDILANLKDVLKRSKASGYSDIQTDAVETEKILVARKDLKKRLKDIESDYC